MQAYAGVHRPFKAYTGACRPFKAYAGAHRQTQAHTDKERQRRYVMPFAFFLPKFGPFNSFPYYHVITRSPIA